MSFCLMDGNEAVAWGAWAAGCRFFAGYPITPATGILNAMLAILPPAGGICLQGEDEIASMGYCLGASVAGMKVMTATSGPGISLCSEQISFAVGSEIPIVIVDVQRLGPSTGSATRGADGDIQFLRWGNSGGLPVFVLAPTDVKDCFELTVEAFNLSEAFRCPVFVASNKEIAMTKESVAIDVRQPRPGRERPAPRPDLPYLPFGVNGDQKVPGFLPIGGRTIVRQTSSTHGPDGYITTNPEEIALVQQRLLEKLQGAPEFFSLYPEKTNAPPDFIILTYGVTSRAARAAVKLLNQEGRNGAVLALKTLWPVPEEIILTQTRHVQQVFVIEMNLGQYINEIQRVLPHKQVHFHGRMDGTLITPLEIMEVVRHAR